MKIPKCPCQSTVIGNQATMVGQIRLDTSNRVESNGGGGELQNAAAGEQA